MRRWSGVRERRPSRSGVNQYVRITRLDDLDQHVHAFIEHDTTDRTTNDYYYYDDDDSINDDDDLGHAGRSRNRSLRPARSQRRPRRARDIRRRPTDHGRATRDDRWPPRVGDRRHPRR